MLRNVMVAVKPPNTPTMLRCQQISGGGWRSPQEQASTSSREFMFAWAIFGGYTLEDMLLLLLFLCGPPVVIPMLIGSF